MAVTTLDYRGGTDPANPSVTEGDNTFYVL